MKKEKVEVDLSGIRKVGKHYEDPKNSFNYIKVKFDEGKWADASKYLPADFDLCYCKTHDRIVSGWHTGTCWDGLNMKPEYKILYWKLNYDN